MNVRNHHRSTGGCSPRGWEVFEGEGVRPFFIGAGPRESALGYAVERARFGTFEIKVFDSAGNLKTVKSARSQADLIP